MGDENRTVAEFYARLWPWIDHARPSRILLDDGGKAQSSHPDMCFFFVGAEREFRVEFKILYTEGNNRNRICPTEKQLVTWQGASSAVAPHVWVAKVQGAEKFLVWPHANATFLREFQGRAAKQTTRKAVKPPHMNALSLSGSFVTLLEYAVREGFLP